MAEVISARIGEDLLTRVDGIRGDQTRAWVASLIERELLAGDGERGTTGSAASSLGAIPDGEPSPGVACAGPGCWQRSTRRYGTRRLPLCDGCKSALTGEPIQRPATAVLARALRGDAA